MTAEQATNSRLRSGQWTVIVLAIAFAAGALLYKVLRHENLGQSSAMFLGIPAVLAIILALTPEARTVTGGIIKGISLALLLVAPLLGEGYLCILVASPLFYFVGIVVGLLADRARKKRAATVSCIALFLLPLCLEGVIPGFQFDRSQTVEASRIITATPAEVESALSRSPSVNASLPRFLRIGFPRPLTAYGHGLELGSTRTIHFDGAEGDPPGDLVLHITERRSGYLRFDAVSDTSKLQQWIAWDASEVFWTPVDATHTAVTWRIRFERKLDPAWYFIPWERTAVHEGAAYLIRANATPTPELRP